MMKLNQLRNFIAVAEAGSIHQAARNLNISQPAITKSIQMLEQQLKAALLIRGTHGVEVTPSGAVLITRAKIVEAELKRAQVEVDLLEGAAAGDISVGVTPAITLKLLPQAVVEFKKAHPNVNVYVEESIYSEVLNRVKLGRFDLAVCLLPGMPAMDGIDVETLIEDRMVPTVRKGHPLTREKNLKLSDLRDEEWIIYGAGEGRRIIFEQTFEQAGLVLPESSLESNAFTFAIRYMETTNAISLLPEHIFQNNNAYKGLAPLHLRDNLLKWKVAAVTRSNSVNTLATSAFIAAFKEIFAS